MTGSANWLTPRVAAHEKPFDSGMLEVGEGNEIYWEEWGVPSGIPALYLHGGRGGTLGSSQYRNRFDLTCTRLVAFEQRGCGRSTPHVSDPSVSLTTNTTAHLVRDIERLREHLGIEAWIVNGVSWGSTLALAYAQACPARVLGIVLFAVTSTSRREVEWITEGVGMVFPEAWDRFASHAEKAGSGHRVDHGRLVEAYARLMEAEDPAVREAASQEWALWEDTHVSIGTGGVHRNPRWDEAASGMLSSGSPRTTGRTTELLTHRYWTRWIAWETFPACWSTAGETSPLRSAPRGSYIVAGRARGSSSMKGTGTAATRW